MVQHQKRMQLSIVIVNYNTGALTSACIGSCLQQSLPRRTEIIVVDNNSADNSVAYLRSDFPEVTVIDNPHNQGLAAGVNVAVNIAKGKFILLLNPDIIALNGSIMNLVNFMSDHDDVGIAGGQLLSPDGSIQNSCFRFYKLSTIIYRRTILGKTPAGRREISRFLMKDFNHTETQDVDWLMGSCLLLRSAAIKEVGGMDERFFLYFEDVDWCRRFWQAGWRVTYVPSSRFSHFHQRASRRGTVGGLLTNWATREHIRSAIKYFLKYRHRAYPRPLSIPPANLEA